MRDFFVSYAGIDGDWAQWIAWQLEDAGYSTIIQAWDFPPGSDFVRHMNEAIKRSRRVLIVLSEAYEPSEWAGCEWPPYYKRNPKGDKSLIVLVRVAPCEPPELLSTRVFVDLVGCRDEGQARDRLVEAIRDLPPLTLEAGDPIEDETPVAERRKPKDAPAFRPPRLTARIDYSRLTPLRVLQGPDEAELFSIAFSPDGKWVAAGSNDTVLLWAIDNTGEPLSTGGHGKYVYSVAFSHDSGRIVTGCEDGHVRVWAVTPELRLLWEKHEHAEAVYSVAFSRDDQYVASGSYDRSVILWDAERGQKLRSSQDGGALAGVGRVTSVAFSPIEPVLAVGSLDDTVRLWNIVDGSARVLGRHNSSVEGIAFSPDGKLLASCGLDKAVRLWRLDKTRKPLLWERRDHEYLVRSVAFSPDGRTLASAGWDKMLKLWRVEDGYMLLSVPFDTRMPFHSDWIWSVAFAPKGMLLASSGSDSRIIVWQVQAPAHP
jgi:WD40 repeat protein